MPEHLTPSDLGANDLTPLDLDHCEALGFDGTLRSGPGSHGIPDLDGSTVFAHLLPSGRVMVGIVVDELPAPAPTYDDLPDWERRRIVDFFLECGEHLASKDEWSMDDNFSTTEDLAELYRHVIKRS